MNDHNHSQRTRNATVRGGAAEELMCASLQEAAWRLRLSGSYAALVPLLPESSLVGSTTVRLGDLLDATFGEASDAVTMRPGVAEVLRPLNPSVS